MWEGSDIIRQAELWQTERLALFQYIQMWLAYPRLYSFNKIYKGVINFQQVPCCLQEAVANYMGIPQEPQSCWTGCLALTVFSVKPGCQISSFPFLTWSPRSFLEIRMYILHLRHILGTIVCVESSCFPLLWAAPPLSLTLCLIFYCNMIR